MARYSITEGEAAAPKAEIEVNGTELGGDIMELVENIEYEHTINMASVITVTLANPGFTLLLSDEARAALAKSQAVPVNDLVSQTVFQWNNELTLWVGRGAMATKPIGRGLIARHSPHYPRDGMPTLQIKAYTKDRLMTGIQGKFTGAQGNKLTAEPKVKEAPLMKRQKAEYVLKTKGGRRESRTDQGRNFPKARDSDVVKEYAKAYGMVADVEETTYRSNFQQPKGMSDYKLIKCLANANGNAFWVDYDFQAGSWVLHWRKTKMHTGQVTPGFIFRYRAGDDTSLLEFTPEYSIQEVATNFEVSGIDPQTGRWVGIIEGEAATGQRGIYQWRVGGGFSAHAKGYADSPIPIPPKERRPSSNAATGDAKTRLNAAAAATKRGEANAALRKVTVPLTPGQQRAIREARATAQRIKLGLRTLQDGSRLRLTVAGTSIDFCAKGRFRSFDELAKQAAALMIQNRDAFVVARGTIVGNNEVFGNQVHEIEGVGPQLDGLWEFKTVTHKLPKNGPYECDFIASKIMETLYLL